MRSIEGEEGLKPGFFFHRRNGWNYAAGYYFSALFVYHSGWSLRSSVYYDGGVVIAVGVMMFAARPIGSLLIAIRPVLALSFPRSGWLLPDSAESFDVHVRKDIYFAMFFSIAVESLNLLRNKRIPL